MLQTDVLSDYRIERVDGSGHCFDPKKRTGFHWIGKWVGVRPALDLLLKKCLISPESHTYSSCLWMTLDT